MERPKKLFEHVESNGDTMWIEDAGTCLNLFVSNFEASMNAFEVSMLYEKLGEWLAKKENG